MYFIPRLKGKTSRHGQEHFQQINTFPRLERATRLFVFLFQERFSTTADPDVLRQWSRDNVCPWQFDFFHRTSLCKSLKKHVVLRHFVERQDVKTLTKRTESTNTTCFQYLFIPQDNVDPHVFQGDQIGQICEFSTIGRNFDIKNEPWIS
jgi:hypothetical protein